MTKGYLTGLLVLLVLLSTFLGLNGAFLVMDLVWGHPGTMEVAGRAVVVVIQIVACAITCKTILNGYSERSLK